MQNILRSFGFSPKFFLLENLLPQKQNIQYIMGIYIFAIKMILRQTIKFIGFARQNFLERLKTS